MTSKARNCIRTHRGLRNQPLAKKMRTRSEGRGGRARISENQHNLPVECGRTKPTTLDNPIGRKRLDATTCPLGQIVIAGSITRFDRQTNGIGAGSHTKRGENRGAMHFDRALAKAQFKRNLLVEPACSQLHQYFTLARA